MRLLVVDDHEVVRRGVRTLLLEKINCDVCGEAVDGQDAIEKARELKPDIVVMDVSMPRLNGLEATRLIRNTLPDVEVVILSQHEAPEMARQALKAGARGYVVKSSISKDLISAIIKVSSREYFFDPAVLDQNHSAHIDVQEILQRSAAFEQALRQSEQLYRSTFELAGVGVGHVSPKENGCGSTRSSVKSSDIANRNFLVSHSKTSRTRRSSCRPRPNRKDAEWDNRHLFDGEALHKKRPVARMDQPDCIRCPRHKWQAATLHIRC
jgi:DNA-binding NarL/FixJ family response regulator